MAMSPWGLILLLQFFTVLCGLTVPDVSCAQIMIVCNSCTDTSPAITTGCEVVLSSHNYQVNSMYGV